MTITILCAGALARPGGQRTDIEAAPGAAPASWLPAARLRNELRSKSSTGAPPLPDDHAFTRRLRRARVAARTRLDEAVPAELPDERWLRERFDLDGTLAACTLDARAGEARTEADDGDAIVVRPVHLHLGLDHCVLAPLATLALAEDEARELAEAANRWLVEDGLELVAERVDAWRIVGRNAAARATLAAFGALRAPSARTASGRNIDAWRPQGDTAAQWRQFENLVQMAWFEHPVNERRAGEGRLPITGLWLEGRAGAARRRAFGRVCTSDPALAGLARRTGADVVAFDADDAANGAPLAPAEAGDTLVDADFWKQAMAEGDPAGWGQAWGAFGDWFGHVRDARRLRIVLTGERDAVELAFEPADRFKPWRSLRWDALLEG